MCRTDVARVNWMKEDCGTNQRMMHGKEDVDGVNANGLC